MDPLSITASTITLIQSLVSAYQVLQHIKNLPKAFKEVGQSLPLLKETLELAHEVLKADKPNESVRKAIEPALEGCRKRAETIKDIFDVIEKGEQQGKDVKDWSVFVRFYRKKVAPLGKAHKVETLMQEILNKLKVLEIHQIFKARAESQGQFEKLENAIRALSEVEPSLPDSDFDGPANNYTMHMSGQARGLMATGNYADIAMGNRNTYSAGTMTFGKE